MEGLASGLPATFSNSIKKIASTRASFGGPAHSRLQFPLKKITETVPCADFKRCVRDHLGIWPFGDKEGARPGLV